MAQGEEWLCVCAGDLFQVGTGLWAPCCLDGSPEEQGVPWVALWKCIDVAHWPASSGCQREHCAATYKFPINLSNVIPSFGCFVFEDLLLLHFAPTL